MLDPQNRPECRFLLDLFAVYPLRSVALICLFVKDQVVETELKRFLGLLYDLHLAFGGAFLGDDHVLGLFGREELFADALNCGGD